MLYAMKEQDKSEFAEETTDMKCPICNKEMSAGYIFHNKKPVQWIPNGKRPSKLAFSITEEGIDIKNTSSFSSINGFRAEAYYCDKCHIVIAPTQ